VIVDIPANVDKARSISASSPTDPLWVVRPALYSDLPAIAALAAITGGGFIGLPDDREVLSDRIARSVAAFDTPSSAPDDEHYMLVLENLVTGQIGGTACLNSRVGARSPFHSFRIGSYQRTSDCLGWDGEISTLTMSRELEGMTEVGGLFLHPELRTGGLGRLLARSRYLLIARYPERFGNRVLAELRGWLTPDGSSPFWDAVGRRFYPVDFREADLVRRKHGSEALAALFPREPLCVDLLPAEARKVLGKPHDNGVPALRLLLSEGFNDFGSIDLLEGGPNLVARTKELATIQGSRSVPLELAVSGGERAVMCAGSGLGFRAWYGVSQPRADVAGISRALAERLDLRGGDVVRHAPA
jgi:arginine N-succinyltransferase